MNALDKDFSGNTNRLGGRMVSLGFFGTFFPRSAFAGNSSTGIVAAMVRDPRIKTLHLFVQEGAALPEGMGAARVKLQPCWSHDHPITLLRALGKMARISRRLDGFVFNVYLTAFGRSRFANGAGMLLPVVLSRLARKPVLVYMHNFLETQDVTKLGYHPGAVERTAVRNVESILLKFTTVIVPLRSQASTVSEVFSARVRCVPLPFIEPFGSAAQGAPVEGDSDRRDGPLRVLLLGSWGPQKDLEGVTRALQAAHDRGGRFTVSLSGEVNVNFPEYNAKLRAVVAQMDPSWFHNVGPVPEADLLATVRDHDLLILPYLATGGYSGAMSLGAYCDIQIIAYDLPQLREFAETLGHEVCFVHGSADEKLVATILSFCSKVQEYRRSRLSFPRPDCDAAACNAVNQVTSTLISQLRGGL